MQHLDNLISIIPSHTTEAPHQIYRMFDCSDETILASSKNTATQYTIIIYLGALLRRSGYVSSFLSSRLPSRAQPEIHEVVAEGLSEAELHEFVHLETECTEESIDSHQELFANAMHKLGLRFALY